MWLKKDMTIVLLASIIFVVLFISKADAQMMGGMGYPMMQGLSGTPTVTPTQQDVQDLQTRKDFFTKFRNNQISCSNLKDDDFEKIGEYLMQQSFGGNTNAHIQINTIMKQMMGKQGEDQMHIRLARNATGCYANGQGGVRGMMGYGGWSGSMMGWNGFTAFGLLAGLIWLVAFIDLILLGFWLFKQVRKK